MGGYSSCINMAADPGDPSRPPGLSPLQRVGQLWGRISSTVTTNQTAPTSKTNDARGQVQQSRTLVNIPPTQSSELTPSFHFVPPAIIPDLESTADFSTQNYNESLTPRINDLPASTNLHDSFVQTIADMKAPSRGAPLSPIVHLGQIHP